MTLFVFEVKFFSEDEGKFLTERGVIAAKSLECAVHDLDENIYNGEVESVKVEYLTEPGFNYIILGDTARLTLKD